MSLRITGVPAAAAATLLALCFSLASVAAHAAAIKWTGAGGNNLWEKAGNWDLNRVPLNTDIITIPGGKGDITTDGTSLQGNNFVITAAALTIDASPADAGATRIIGNNAGKGVSITVDGDLTIGVKSGVRGVDGAFGGSVQLVSNAGNVKNSGNIIAGKSVQTSPCKPGGRVSVTGLTIFNDGLLQSGDAGIDNNLKNSTWYGRDGGEVRLTAKNEASPAITNAGIIQTGKGGTGGGKLDDRQIFLIFTAGRGGDVVFDAPAKATVFSTGQIITGDGGANGSAEAGQSGGAGGSVITYDATFVPPIIALPLQAVPVLKFGDGGAGTAGNPVNHPKAAKGRLLARKLKVQKAAGGRLLGRKLKVQKAGEGQPLRVAALSDSFYTCSYAYLDGGIQLSDPEGTLPSVDLSSLNVTAICADSCVIFNLCPLCTLDLRGNDGSTKIIRAGLSICIFGNVLTDPGVSVADLTDPPAIVSNVSLPCAIPAAATAGVTITAEGGSDNGDLPNIMVFPPSKRTANQIAPGEGTTPNHASPVCCVLEVDMVGHPLGVRFGFAPLRQSGRLTVYDVCGRVVSALNLEPTSRVAVWDETDRSGRRVPTGIYLARLEGRETTLTGRLVIVR